MHRNILRPSLILGMLLIALVPAATRAPAEDVTPYIQTANREELRHHEAAALAALNIYNTFGCIGLTADLYEAKEFNHAKVQQVTNDLIKTSDLAIEMLKNARTEEGEAGADVPYEDLIKCYYLLDREARLLEEAAETGDKDRMQQFYQAREETWAKVKEVLGIEDTTKDDKEPKK